MKRKLTIILIMTLIILIFKNYELVLKSTIDGVTIWLYKVFPYLFIMIIMQDILINLNLTSYFKRTSTYIFIMSILSGSPSSAYIISKLVNNNDISKDYGNVCLIFTFFANPLFLYTILKLIFNNNPTTIKLLIIIYLSNLLLYLFYKKELPNNRLKGNPQNINLALSIKTSVNTNLMVLGSIVFYLVISNIIINTFNISYPYSIFVKGFLEMTQGLNSLIDCNIKLKEIITVGFITFGGLSIHTQVKCILDEYNLSYKYFLKGRILQMIIAIFLTAIT